MTRIFPALIASFLLVSTVSADVFFTGDTTGGPTFARPTSFTTTGSAGFADFVRYQAFQFFTDTTGQYIFEVDGQVANGFTHTDTFALVYNGSFTAGTPLVNLIAGDDDFAAAFTLLSGTGGNFTSSQIRLGEGTNFGGAATGLLLTANTTYVAVIAGFDNPDFGTYRAAIGDGAGGGTVYLGAIPEPTSALLLAGIGMIGLVNRRRR